MNTCLRCVLSNDIETHLHLNDKGLYLVRSYKFPALLELDSRSHRERIKTTTVNEGVQESSLHLACLIGREIRSSSAENKPAMNESKLYTFVVLVKLAVVQ